MASLYYILLASAAVLDGRGPLSEFAQRATLHRVLAGLEADATGPHAETMSERPERDATRTRPADSMSERPERGATRPDVHPEQEGRDESNATFKNSSSAREEGDEDPPAAEAAGRASAAELQGGAQAAAGRAGAVSGVWRSAVGKVDAMLHKYLKPLYDQYGYPAEESGASFAVVLLACFGGIVLVSFLLWYYTHATHGEKLSARGIFLSIVTSIGKITAACCNYCSGSQRSCMDRVNASAVDLRGTNTDVQNNPLLVQISNVKIMSFAAATGPDARYYCYVLNCPRGIGGPEPSETLLRTGRNRLQKTGVGGADERWREGTLSVSCPKEMPELQIALYSAEGRPSTIDSLPETGYVASTLLVAFDLLQELNALLVKQKDAVPLVKRKYNMLDVKGSVMAKASVSFYRPNYQALLESGFSQEVLRPYSLRFVRALDEARARAGARVTVRLRADTVEEATLRAQVAVLAKLLTGNLLRRTEEDRVELVWFEADSHFWVWHTGPSDEGDEGAKGVQPKVVAGFVALKSMHHAVEAEGGQSVRVQYVAANMEKELVLAANPDDPIRNHEVLLQACQLLATIVGTIPARGGGSKSVASEKSAISSAQLSLPALDSDLSEDISLSPLNTEDDSSDGPGREATPATDSMTDSDKAPKRKPAKKK